MNSQNPSALLSKVSSRLASWCARATLLIIAALGSALAAHVTLDAPNGGEVLTIGDEVVIEWTLAIQHNTENWDLWYSISGANGPWIPIVADLPLGDPAAGSVHTFLWVVPVDPSEQVRVRVRQDNSGLDYEDISDDDLTIAANDLFSDGFESGNFDAWTVVESP